MAQDKFGVLGSLAESKWANDDKGDTRAGSARDPGISTDEEI